MAKRSGPRLDERTMRNVGAIVLGGGRGTRLYPLTKLRAKPAVPLCGRYRLIDIPLSNCIHSEINRVVVLTQFNSHSLNRHIISTYQFDDFTNGYVEVLAAEQTNETRDWFQGTADAVRKQLLHILDTGIDHFVILSGDQLYRMDYRSLMQTHLKNDADMTVCALPVDRQAARDFGTMKVRQNGRIYDFVEKPNQKEVLDALVTPQQFFDDFGFKAKGKPYLASMGIYAFKAKVLESVLLAHPEWIDFGKEILPQSLRTHKVFAHMFYGFWEDIGTVRSYFDVSMAITSANPPFQFHDPVQPIYTHARILPGARILDAKIRNAIICAGSRINNAVITDAIIGIRSIIRPGASISRSIILGADHYETAGEKKGRVGMGIGQNTTIRNAIIDHDARIGKGVTIRGSKKMKDYEGDGYSIRDGIVVVHKRAVIPNGTKIG